jgi:hypothetical protein
MAKILRSKTVAMLALKVQDRQNVPQTESYELDDGIFGPFCTKFNYFGFTITCDLDGTTESERRLSHVQMAFNTLWKILCNQRLRVDSGASYTRCAT